MAEPINNPINNQELQEQLDMIAKMIAAGRQTTERWGWTFVLWGVAYLVAMAWEYWGPHASLAWPVTVVATVLLMFARIAAQNRSMAERQPETTMGRAIYAVWASMGTTMFFLLLFLSMSGRFDWHLFVALIGALLGLANAASSLILKWRAQFCCALVWWATMTAACFGSDRVTTGVFLGAIFLCQIVFGTYCMVLEARNRKGSRAAHA